MTIRRLGWIGAGFGLVAILVVPYLLYRSISYPVVALAETAPVPNPGDAADDPCIWIHPDDPQQSLIIGTDKKGGLAVFDLGGELLQFLELGRINNVDSRPGFPFEDGTATLIAASDKDEDSVLMLRVERATRRLVVVGSVRTPPGFSADGLCLYRSPASGGFHAFVTSKKGPMVQMRLFSGARTGQGELARTIEFGSVTEGCVADDENGALYVSEENVGIWKVGAEPDGGQERTLIDSTGPLGRLRHDVEGLGLYQEEGGAGYLVASNQGRDDFLVYRRDGRNECVGRFRIVAEGGIDEVTHCDGIDVVSVAVGPDYPRGLLIVQDDEDESGFQNFKLVPWERVETVIKKPF